MAGQGDNFVCEARRYGERLYCGRCELADIKLDALVCKTPAECGLILTVIRAALEAEADRIDGSTDVAVKFAEQLLADGHRVEPGPDRGRLRSAAALRAGARLIARIETDEGIKQRLKGRAG